MKIYLEDDDKRTPQACKVWMPQPEYFLDDWVRVRSYLEFEQLLNKLISEGKYNEIDLISFDHDLADEHYTSDMWKGKDYYNKHYNSFKEKTGLSCAQLLVDKCLDHNLKLPRYYVHSLNPVGGPNILYLLDNFNNFQNA